MQPLATRTHKHAHAHKGRLAWSQECTACLQTPLPWKQTRGSQIHWCALPWLCNMVKINNNIKRIFLLNVNVYQDLAKPHNINKCWIWWTVFHLYVSHEIKSSICKQTLHLWVCYHLKSIDNTTLNISNQFVLRCLKSNLTAAENLVFADLQWFNLLSCCSDVWVYSRGKEYAVTSLLEVATGATDAKLSTRAGS